MGGRWASEGHGSPPAGAAPVKSARARLDSAPQSRRRAAHLSLSDALAHPSVARDGSAAPRRGGVGGISPSRGSRWTFRPFDWPGCVRGPQMRSRGLHSARLCRLVLGERSRVPRPRGGTFVQPCHCCLQLSLRRPEALRERHPLVPVHAQGAEHEAYQPGWTVRLLGLARQPRYGGAPRGRCRARRRHEAPVTAGVVGAGGAVPRVCAVVGAEEEGAAALELGAAAWAAVGDRAHASKTPGAAVVTWRPSTRDWAGHGHRLRRRVGVGQRPRKSRAALQRMGDGATGQARCNNGGSRH